MPARGLAKAVKSIGTQGLRSTSSEPQAEDPMVPAPSA
jgi:hypothetical protein